MRRWLLENGRIQEAEDGLLNKDMVKDGDWVLLFNGVRGCRLGRISLGSCVPTAE
jgi:4-amino-4-deoxychorismate lyase